MANSYTTNLNLTKPEVGADTDAWGGHLNTDLDTLDAIFKSDGTGTSVGFNVGSGKTLTVNGTVAGTGLVTPTGTQTLTNKTISGASNTISNISLTTAVTGLLPVANGGTGISTTPGYGVLPIGNGTNYTAAALTAGTGVSINNGPGAITIALPQAVATTSSVQFASFGVGTSATGTSGEIRATNNITAYYSDDRLKTRLGAIENPLAKLKTLDGFYYEANATAQGLGYTAIREVGVSAQSVQAILPEIVAPAPIDDRYLTVRYERLVPLLIEAIKELAAEVEALKG
jgi:hypothetical protein